ncbi:unnamed protein product [Leptosia nina]|uniref:Uncharacterized protein n=1 Tax=Leptosia nina TaxID=320188 RepID=A0AAV1K5Y7_9NEOP
MYTRILPSFEKQEEISSTEAELISEVFSKPDEGFRETHSSKSTRWIARTVVMATGCAVGARRRPTAEVTPPPPRMLCQPSGHRFLTYQECVRHAK